MLKRDGPQTRAQILQIINSLVNGKFKAKFELEGKKVLWKYKFKGTMQLTLKIAMTCYLHYHCFSTIYGQLQATTCQNFELDEDFC